MRITGLGVSLTYKIIILRLAMSLLCILITGALIYSNIRKHVIEENIYRINNDIEFIISSIDRDIGLVDNLVNWTTLNYSIRQFLDPEKNTGQSRGLNSIIAFDALRTHLFNSPISPFVCKVLIQTKDGRTISTGLNPGIADEAGRIKSYPYYQMILSAESYYWIGLGDAVFSNGSRDVRKKIIPVIWPIMIKQTRQVMGWIFIGLSADILSSRIAERAELKNSRFIWNIGYKYYIYENGDFLDISGEITTWDTFGKDSPEKTAITLNGKKTEVIGLRSAFWDWTLMELMEGSGDLQIDIVEILFMELFVFILFSFVMYGLITRIIVKPIRKIERHIESIGAGNFTSDPGIEGSDEIGAIGRSINRMSADISRLMDEHIRIESSKRDLELANLQKQISPHFIYNTLNTIKWMAIIQQAQGIEEVVDTMVAILREIVKDTRLHVTVMDEIVFLESYIKLIRFQYGDTFSYRVFWDDPSLENASILKFTLQPIVENAIFHGLDPHEKTGELRIQIGRQGDDLLITIFDNGAGMNEKQINTLLNTRISSGNILKELGISNVDSRIKLEYGPSYGIHIESVLGEYTKVFILYPYRTQGGNSRV
jgi:two-component system sensor histidine kinase YesM